MLRNLLLKDTEKQSQIKICSVVHSLSTQTSPCICGHIESVHCTSKPIFSTLRVFGVSNVIEQRKRCNARNGICITNRDEIENSMKLTRTEIWNESRIIRQILVHKSIFTMTVFVQLLRITSFSTLPRTSYTHMAARWKSTFLLSTCYQSNPPHTMQLVVCMLFSRRLYRPCPEVFFVIC